MSEEERREILDNTHVLETYVTVLKQACHVFRREFIHIGNIEVLVLYITIASACN